MRLRPGAHVAVIGAGPSGLVAARHALQAGFDTTVFEASDDLGGQWHTRASHSGIWPGMRTNTSRTMTAFSELPPPSGHELYPLAEQVQAYLRSYAALFGVGERIRFGFPVTSVAAAGDRWSVDGALFDAVVVASGRFRAPLVPAGLETFDGELLHAYDYPGADAFRDQRVLVFGNGVSGHEIASDVAAVAAMPVVSSYRKPRYVLQKVVDGVPSDWRWYTHAAALERVTSPPEEWGPRLRERVVAVSGNPADFGAPAPGDDLLVAGHSLCQDYLAQVSRGEIRCRPGLAAVDGRTVTFTDDTTETVDVIICATGYAVDVPYLSEDVRRILGPALALHVRTLSPHLPGLAFLGQFALQGPYFPLLELQARWVVGVWSGAVPAPSADVMTASIRTPAPAIDSHHVLALALAEQAGMTPDIAGRPNLAEALLHGPMLPARYRLDGPGALPGAAEQFAAQLQSSSRAPVDPEDVARSRQLSF